MRSAATNCSIPPHVWRAAWTPNSSSNQRHAASSRHSRAAAYSATTRTSRASRKRFSPKLPCASFVGDVSKRRVITTVGAGLVRARERRVHSTLIPSRLVGQGPALPLRSANDAEGLKPERRAFPFFARQAVVVLVVVAPARVEHLAERAF